MEKIVVTDVEPEDVEILWAKVKGHLQKAVERNQGEFNLDDIYTGLIINDMRLWIVYNEEGELLGSAVCEIQNYPQKKVCLIRLLGGDEFVAWIHTIKAIEEWAVENGADSIVAYSRKGFVKLMKPYGYKEAYTVISRNLSERRIH